MERAVAKFQSLSTNCEKIVIFRSLETLRKSIFDYLRKNPLDNDRFPLMTNVYSFDNWADYVNSMAGNGTLGDQEIFLATSNSIDGDVVAI